MVEMYMDIEVEMEMMLSMDMELRMAMGAGMLSLAQKLLIPRVCNLRELVGGGLKRC